MPALVPGSVGVAGLDTDAVAGPDTLEVRGAITGSDGSPVTARVAFWDRPGTPGQPMGAPFTVVETVVEPAGRTGVVTLGRLDAPAFRAAAASGTIRIEITLLPRTAGCAASAPADFTASPTRPGDFTDWSTTALVPATAPPASPTP